MSHKSVMRDDTKGAESIHKSVMRDELLNILNNINSVKSILDVTFGAGGHSRLLKSHNYNVICLDQDIESIQYNNNEFQLINDKFSNINKYFKQDDIDCIFADLGVSSMQIDNSERGFSYHNNGPLDMRMNNTNGLSLSEQIKKMHYDIIKNILQEFGEFKYFQAKKIAQNIIQYRISNDIITTHDLIKASGLNSYKDISRLFQGFRIYINDEMYELKTLLKHSKIASKGVIIITFHSIEDRIVKNFLNIHYNQTLLLLPSEEEIKLNPRARSAKMRAGFKI
jgi:16S rRNA (cytosine1402-N4)-methyltransferase